MLAPVTVTGANGVTIALSRSGDRVQAAIAIPPALQQLGVGTIELPAPFRPLGSVVIQGEAPGSSYMFVVNGEGVGVQAGVVQLVQFGSAPFPAASVAWLGEAVEGERSLSDRLREYVSGDARQANLPVDYLAETLREAFELVERACGSAVVPEAVRSRAIIEVGSELFHRKQAPNGISQFAAPDGSPMRVARDPMNAARAILAPYLPLGFA